MFEIVRVLDRAGARLDKVVISHLEERFRDDLRLFKRLAPTGVRFGFDTFGREIYYDARRKQHPSDTQRIDLVRRLLDLDLGDRIGLAQDICLRHELSGFGGQGYGLVELAVVLEELGRAVAPGPFLPTALAAAVVQERGTDEQQARWLPGMVDGSTPAAVAFSGDAATPMTSGTARS